MKNSLKALLLTLSLAAAVFASGCNNSTSNPAKTTEKQEAPVITTTYAAGTASTSSNSPESEAVTSSSDVGSSQTSSDVSGSQTPSSNYSNLWSTAKYKEDTELGEGAITLNVKVIAGDKTITVKLHTDKDNLGDALLGAELVSGDVGEYGLYIKLVNGIEADYDKNAAYWAISRDGEMLMTGADSTKIADGENYELTYTK